MIQNSIKTEQMIPVKINKPNLFNTYPRIMANPKNRVIVHDKNERNEYIQEYISYRQIYMSVYSFSKIEDTLYQTHQNAIVDKIFIDIDPDDCDPYIEMMKVHNFLLNDKILHRIHLSGRGFHIFVCILKNTNFPKFAIMNYWDYLHGPLKCYDCYETLEKHYCKKCMKEVKYKNVYNIENEYISPQFSICSSTRGDLGRIFRYPNTYNWKSKCYSIVIDDILLNKYHSLEEFQKFAVKPYKPRGKTYFGSEYLNISEFDCTQEYFDNSNYIQLIIDPMSFGHTKINYDVEFDIAECPICIQELVKHDLHFAERNELIKFLRCRTDIEFPYMPDEIMGILWKVSENNKHLRDKFNNNLIGQIYRNVMVIFENEEIISSCKKIALLNLCDKSKCNWKNIHDKI